ncbi:flagellar rod protein [Citrobacter amalonaticus]|uniref:Basal-body rod modification protein FlgD n=1 Tax=Citrobacter amalonaticus TaxID=35703 RepID=A0A2S4RRL2_CITAM|nr:flagellar hook capping FlgD N-terminal domain-containing protein [Citrobacter amalonaticus]POT58658.1 flagellar rod protein [Citrobacter amalonaticus]POT70396.1 flagellar rod protein [Citrobacter amalonaticus]POU61380.1 flagellar rod protein [Citrobacter amalonaticus]POV05052.1 flagellar rod protein [Citrobacter amalonaticus]
MNTLALYAESQTLSSSAGETAVAENSVGDAPQSSNVEESSGSSTSADATDTSNTSGTPTTTTTTESSGVETFLTLFVAEIENQDPTDPADSTEYIDQLASMAQVAMMEEMSVEANTNAILMSNIQVMALGNMVGDDIMVQTTSLEVSDEEIKGRVTLDDACTEATLHFTDEAGDDYAVSLIPEGETSVGPGQVDFDINPADYAIPPGDYSVSVVTNTGEEEVPIEVSGTVEDVRIPLDGSAPMLNVTGVGEVPFTMLSQFGIPDNTNDVTPPDSESDVL